MYPFINEINAQRKLKVEQWRNEHSSLFQNEHSSRS